MYWCQQMHTFEIEARLVWFGAVETLKHRHHFSSEILASIRPVTTAAAHCQFLTFSFFKIDSFSSLSQWFSSLDALRIAGGPQKTSPKEEICPPTKQIKPKPWPCHGGPGGRVAPGEPRLLGAGFLRWLYVLFFLTLRAASECFVLSLTLDSCLWASYPL